MRTLGTISILGITTYVVYATQEEATPHLEGDYTEGAHYAAGSSTIYIRDWQEGKPEATYLWGVFLHEVLHAAFHLSSARRTLRDALPHLSTEARDDIEEQLVLALAPALLTCIPDLGGIITEIAEVCAVAA